MLDYWREQYCRVITICNNRRLVIDCRKETVQCSPGLYWQREDTATLYVSEWKAVACLSLQGASNTVDARGST